MITSTALSVTQVTRYLKSIIDGDSHLQSLYITGEISNFTNHYRTGHFYFTLKDESCSIKAVMFRSSAQRLRFLPQNGMRVLARGRVSLYERDGQYQLYAEDLQPDGVGALNLAYEQLKSRLEEEGLFDSRRKRPLPRFPARVGVITSPTGAAVQDILQILGRRFPLAQVVFAPVQVQGENAAPQIVQAIERMNRIHAADVLIVGRGGGSLEDLWAFNEETVARAVAVSRIPVVSAVGHETDFTICDFAADMRAPTPSGAAELAVPDRGEQRYYLSSLQKTCGDAILRRIQSGRLLYRALSASLSLHSPSDLVRSKRIELDNFSNRLLLALQGKFTYDKKELSVLAGKLHALSPLSVLSRGFAIAYRDSRILRSVQGIFPGEEIKVALTDGTMYATVIKTEKLEGAADEKANL